MDNEIAKKIVQWLKNELIETRTKGFVLGLSGGLDSAVCAVLAKMATDDTLCLILPIESNIEDIDDASEVAAKFNLKTQYIDLTSVYNNLIRFLPDKNQIARGNVKARLRMIVLYYYANIHNYLVCGTGNKTELSLGYFTKYGDGACDVLPIGDLYKHEVKALARELGISEKIIKKVPSAGLWSGQTDEREIGFSYDEMDKSLQEIELGKISNKTGKILAGMIKKTTHKRNLPKICYLEK